MAVSRDAVEKDARAIMNSFLKVLERVHTSDDPGFVERDESMRDQGVGVCDDDFRKRMMENAPRKKDGYILTEKGEWKS